MRPIPLHGKASVSLSVCLKECDAYDLCSIIILQEEIKDLLSKDHKRKLELKERPDTGIYVKVRSNFPYM